MTPEQRAKDAAGIAADFCFRGKVTYKKLTLKGYGTGRRKPNESEMYHSILSAIEAATAEQDAQIKELKAGAYSTDPELNGLSYRALAEGQSEKIEDLQEEIHHIEQTCNNYDEFDHPVDPECELPRLAGRVHGTIAEQAEQIKSLLAVIEPFAEIYCPEMGEGNDNPVLDNVHLWIRVIYLHAAAAVYEEVTGGE